MRSKRSFKLDALFIILWLAAAIPTILTAGAKAQTASVTVTLSINDDGTGSYSPDDFAVYGSDSITDGNGGISGFRLDVANYSTLINVSPAMSYQAQGATYELGFTTDRVPPLQGTLPHDDLTGFQGSGSQTPALVIGFGQTPGNLEGLLPDDATLAGQPVQPAYGDPLLLASGTFTSPPSWSVGLEGNGFYVINGSQFESVIPTLATQTVMPEPGALNIFAMTGAILLVRPNHGGKHAT